jgi:hypothetical protein
MFWNLPTVAARSGALTVGVPVPMSFQLTLTVVLIPSGSASPGTPEAAAPSWNVPCTEPLLLGSVLSVGNDPSASRPAVNSPSSDPG